MPVTAGRSAIQAIVTVTNDLVSDNRVQRTCSTLMDCGYTVTLIGRELPQSPTLPPLPYKAIRMKLLFKSGPLFYFFFNLRLFFQLLFRKTDLVFANDLDTLPACWLAARMKKAKLVYDSHELFCEVPELQRSPLKKKVWETIERLLVPGTDARITVNGSIAAIFESKYGVKFNVVRNIPLPVNFTPADRAELGLPADKQIVILQGAGINIDRGAEELVEAFASVDAVLLIIGSGDVWPLLKSMVRELRLEAKVRLIARLPKEKLMQYTRCANLAISIDKPTNLNYVNSLPNKIFDYLYAGVPILASRLPEIERIVAEHEVGEFIENHQPQHIALRISQMLTSPVLTEYAVNASQAAKAFSGAEEQAALARIILSLREAHGKKP